MAVLSAATAGTRLCPALSWNELSGRGEGTAQKDRTKKKLEYQSLTQTLLQHKYVLYLHILAFKSLGPFLGILFLNIILVFRRHINIKSGSKDIYNVTSGFYFK